MASPRARGNTDLLLTELLRGAAEAGTAVEELRLRDLKIGPCLEIYHCRETGRCAIKDDFNRIYEKFATASGLIIATPIFFYAMPAQLKALVDRCQSFYLRKYELKRPLVPPGAPKRPAYVLAVGGSRGEKVFDGMFLSLKYFFDALDCELKEKLLYRQIDAPGDILKHPSAIKDAYALGQRLIIEPRE